MILLNTKTFEELQEEDLNNLQNVGFSTSAGSIAKLFLGIINRNIADLYDVLTLNHVQSFVSTATGSYLEAVGALVACERLLGEEDADYRYRISKSILSTATANETAVRLAALSVTGVRDAILKKYTYGTGSFSVLITTDSPVPSPEIIASVQSNVEKVTAYGTRFEVTGPDVVSVKLTLKLMTKDTTSIAVSQDLKYSVRQALRDFFATRQVGEAITPSQITQEVMNVNTSIVTYTCERFNINGSPAMFVNQDCRWNERFMLSADPDALIIL